jgi:multidrug efflux pump
MPGSNYAQFIVNTIGNKATEEMIAEYKDKYLNYFPNVRVRFKQLEYSEAAYPIEMRVKDFKCKFKFYLKEELKR